MQELLIAAIVFAVAAVLFIVARHLVLWYFNLSNLDSNQKEIIKLLTEQNKLLRDRAKREV